MSSHRHKKPLMGTNRPMELWVGFVNHVPLVGTSANMVDGFIALLQGDQRTAEAKGYKGFLDLPGVHELTPGSILQNHEGQTVIGCSVEVSKDINDYIIQAVRKPGASATIKVTKAVRARTDLRKKLSVSFKVLRDKLNERGVDLASDVTQKQRSKRGEHVFNRALLELHASIIEKFWERGTRRKSFQEYLVRIPHTQVHDAIHRRTPKGLTTDQARNISTWVVDIPDNVVYIPINNILFSYLIYDIKVNAVDCMNLYCKEENNEMELAALTKRVDWMIMHRVYLDPQAAEWWFAENPNLIYQFDDTESGVKDMLKLLDPQRSFMLILFANELMCELHHFN
ncbi:uncharacterized protein LOC135246360 [Anguilla rostrata]|uniref:uncharacterized protein LOC135246360 n=1 Tax=Anguilla rostrata TaxID=7938 RepID=UPI0030D4D930